MSDSLRILFFGTPEFAVPSLRALAASRHVVVGVVSQPDRVRGRGQKLSPTPVREVAEELGLALLQPEKVGDGEALAWMTAREPDIGCVVAFGQFIPKKVRELPPKKLINAHGSLLPRWRGAAPIEWAVRAGDATTGISVMYVEKEMDSGAVCLVRETPIAAGETAGELRERLADLAAEALVEACDEIADGTARFVAQDPADITDAPKLDRDFARLDWTGPAHSVLSTIRAATPRPGCDIELVNTNKTLRIQRARPSEIADDARPGSVRVLPDALAVRAGDGWVEITEVQPPGKRAQTAAEFMRGARIPADEEVQIR